MVRLLFLALLRACEAQLHNREAQIDEVEKVLLTCVGASDTPRYRYMN